MKTNRPDNKKYFIFIVSLSFFPHFSSRESLKDFSSRNNNGEWVYYLYMYVYWRVEWKPKKQDNDVGVSWWKASFTLTGDVRTSYITKPQHLANVMWELRSFSHSSLAQRQQEKKFLVSLFKRPRRTFACSAFREREAYVNMMETIKLSAFLATLTRISSRNF